MSSIGKIRVAFNPRALESRALVDAGILSAPDSPDGAFRRAKALLREGKYQEARSILYPHVRSAPLSVRPRLAEVLARCAVHVGGDWETLIRAAAESYDRPGDRGRVHHLWGDALLLRGDFDGADAHYQQAEELFTQADDFARAALANCFRGRVELRAGHITRALERVDRALEVLLPLQRPRDEGITRLDRARILACLGRGEASARDAVAGERLLASSADRGLRIRAPLARAEALWLLGESERATEGLRRILVDVVDIDDVGTRAWVHTLLGRCLGQDQLPAARRHLMRGKHLYEGLRSDFGVATCELWLCQVDHRLGLAVNRRLQELRARPIEHWPLFAAELGMVHAEVLSAREPDAARRLLFDARAFGIGSGNRSLVRRIDEALRALRLVTVDDLTPIDDERTLPSAQGGVSVSQTVPVGGLQRLEDTSTSRAAPVSQARTQTRQQRAARLVGQLTKAKSDITLVPPATARVKR